MQSLVFTGGRKAGRTEFTNRRRLRGKALRPPGHAACAAARAGLSPPGSRARVVVVDRPQHFPIRVSHKRVRRLRVNHGNARPGAAVHWQVALATRGGDLFT
jgi:hypothetical protein